MCLRGQRGSGSINAMIRGSFVVLSVFCVSKTRPLRLTFYRHRLRLVQGSFGLPGEACYVFFVFQEIGP